MGQDWKMKAKGQNPGRCRNREGGDEQDGGGDRLRPFAMGMAELPGAALGVALGGMGGSMWAKVGENASPRPNAPDSHSYSLLC